MAQIYPKIRLGTPRDEEPLLEMAMQAWSENGINNVNKEKMRGTIRPALYLWQGLVGLIGEKGKNIEAAIVLRTGQMWYSDDSILEEKAIFVAPEFRHGKSGNKKDSQNIVGHARALCEFSKRVAKEMDMPLIIGVLSNNRTKSKIRLYQHHFGEPAGAFFLYNAKTGHTTTEH